ncbi:MAG: hypothetical protein PHP37_02610 [Patescibacteria group bacterium]|nr:hypothetical protein [Patescibacteria group bacterium]
MIDLKKETSENKISDLGFVDKKNYNKVNKFFNSYFRFIAVFVLIVFLWVTIRFMIKPKFEDAIVLSNNALKQKKVEFLSEYKKMEKYKRVIAEFSEIDSVKIDKINKMVPSAYSRDDLFTEITYFLIKDNFKINGITIADPIATAGSAVAVTEESGEGAFSGRRSNTVSTEESNAPVHSNYLKTLSPELGVWLVNLRLNNINYQDLKKLLITLENNLKLIDIFSINFQPTTQSVDISFFTYYKK